MVFSVLFRITMAACAIQVPSSSIVTPGTVWNNFTQQEQSATSLSATFHDLSKKDVSSRRTFKMLRKGGIILLRYEVGGLLQYLDDGKFQWRPDYPATEKLIRDDRRPDFVYQVLGTNPLDFFEKGTGAIDSRFEIDSRSSGKVAQGQWHGGTYCVVFKVIDDAGEDQLNPHSVSVYFSDITSPKLTAFEWTAPRDGSPYTRKIVFDQYLLGVPIDEKFFENNKNKTSQKRLD